MADEAKAKAGALLDALLPFAERGIAIVGLEPSCLLTLRDEMLVMGLGDDGANGRPRRRCCSRSSSRAKRGPAASRSALAAGDKPMLVHGHCHQKAFGAMQPVLDVLRLIPGAQAVD